jgi:TatD DNase family protein
MDEAAWRALEDLVVQPSVRAVGEIGLDYFRNLSPPEAQREALARQLDLAATHGLPVVVHDRDAHADVTATLLAWAGTGQGRRGMIHAFSGDGPMAAELAGAGFVVSFALPLTFRSTAGPQEAAVVLPDGAFLVETDAPYLGADRETNNEPSTALRVAVELSRLRGVPAEAIATSVRATYDALISG